MNKALSFILIVSLAAGAFSGCVPSPSGGDNTYPEFTLLHLFYTPQQTSTVYLWRDSSAAGIKYTEVTYVRDTVNPYSKIYPTASYFVYTDSATHFSTTRTVAIEDSAIVEYVAASDTSAPNPVVRLRGVLSVTSGWTACEHFVTSNGAAVKINAVVDDYYAATSVGGVQYADTYHVTYTITNMASPSEPLEPQYQKGATLGIYFVKTLGPTYITAKDASGNTLWVNQLVETHSK